jgi:phage gp45-like
MGDQKVKVAMANSITRCLINRSGADGFDVQMTWLSGRTTPDVENFQPQGVHFRVPAKSEAVAVSPGGIADNVVVVGASNRKALPEDELGEGEGGLHYLGEYKVFLAANGTVSLGAKDASDYVALASLVKDELDALKADLDVVKQAIDAGFGAITEPGGGPAAVGAVNTVWIAAAGETAPGSGIPGPWPAAAGEVASTIVKAD